MAISWNGGYKLGRSRFRVEYSLNSADVIDASEVKNWFNVSRGGGEITKGKLTRVINCDNLVLEKNE